MTALPNVKFFLEVPYSTEWREEFKDYFRTLQDANDALYLLNLFTKRLGDIKNKGERKSKGDSIVNRLHELKKKIYMQKFSVAADEDIDKVGCVVVRKNNDALFTTIPQDDGTIKYGFPKGKFEYKLQNPGDIYTVYGEGYANGALRELNEETGFKFTGKINLREGIYTGVLDRTLDGKSDSLPILGGSHAIYGDGFYLILYVGSVGDLNTHEVPKNEEGISSCVWEKQYTADSTRSYNGFSKHRFEFPPDEFFDVENNDFNNIQAAPPPPVFKKKKKGKTLKRGAKPNSSPKKRSKSKYGKTRFRNRTI